MGDGKEFVIEGDEYDSAFFDKRAKFLHYCPKGVILGSVEFDHSDIYRDIKEVELAFKRLLLVLPRNAVLVAMGDSERVQRRSNTALCPVVTFGYNDNNDWLAVDTKSTDRGMEFRLVYQGTDCGQFTLGVWGSYNVVNALGAMAMAYSRGVSLDYLKMALLF